MVFCLNLGLNVLNIVFHMVNLWDFKWKASKNTFFHFWCNDENDSESREEAKALSSLFLYISLEKYNILNRNNNELMAEISHVFLWIFFDIKREMQIYYTCWIEHYFLWYWKFNREIKNEIIAFLSS